MYKLAVFDIDGTLTVKGNFIPESTLKAIELLKEKGIKCLIATGRGKSTLLPISRETGIRDYIALNGQYVSFNGEVLYSYTFPDEIVERVKEICKESKGRCSYGLICERGYYIPHLKGTKLSRGTSASFKRALITRIRPGEAINQIVIFSKPENYHLFDELRGDYNFNIWHSDGFDITINSRDKLVGIKEVADRLDISMEDVITFGDGENDKEMLEGAGFGVAIKGAIPEVIKCADILAPSPSEDGIFKICKELKLID